TEGGLYPSQPIPVVLGNRETPPGAAVRRHPRRPLFYGGDDLHAMLADLRRRGVHRVFVEGGPTIASAFVRTGLADEVLVYQAPVLLGGDRLALGDIGVGTIADARRFAVASLEPLGEDLLIVLHPAADPRTAKEED